MFRFGLRVRPRYARPTLRSVGARRTASGVLSPTDWFRGGSRSDALARDRGAVPTTRRRPAGLPRGPGLLLRRPRASPPAASEGAPLSALPSPVGGLRGPPLRSGCPLLDGRPVGAVRFRLRRSVALRAHPVPTLTRGTRVKAPARRKAPRCSTPRPATFTVALPWSGVVNLPQRVQCAARRPEPSRSSRARSSA